MSLTKFIIRKLNFYNHMRTHTHIHTQTDGIFPSSFLPWVFFLETIRTAAQTMIIILWPKSSACSSKSVVIKTFAFSTSYFINTSLCLYLFDTNFPSYENVMENELEIEHSMENWIIENRWPIIKSHLNKKPLQMRWKTFQIDELMKIPTNYMKVSICLHIGDSSTNKNKTYPTLMNTWHLAWWLKANVPHSASHTVHPTSDTQHFLQKRIHSPM